MECVFVSAPRKHLVTVSFSDGTEVLLDSDFAAEKGIQVGFCADCETVKSLYEESENRRAFSRGCYYLADSDYSERGMAEKLKKAGFSEEASGFAVEKIKSLGYIDDRKYALRLAEIMTERNLSEREIIYKLGLKGIDRKTAIDTLEGLDYDESEKIVRLIESKYSKKLECDSGTEKVTAALARHGFSFEDIKHALRIIKGEVY